MGVTGSGKKKSSKEKRRSKHFHDIGVRGRATGFAPKDNVKRDANNMVLVGDFFSSDEELEEDTAASPELALSADSDAEFEKSSVYGDYDEPEAMTPIVTPVKQLNFDSEEKAFARSTRTTRTPRRSGVLASSTPEVTMSGRATRSRRASKAPMVSPVKAADSVKSTRSTRSTIGSSRKRGSISRPVEDEAVEDSVDEDGGLADQTMSSFAGDEAQPVEPSPVQSERSEELNSAPASPTPKRTPKTITKSPRSAFKKQSKSKKASASPAAAAEEDSEQEEEEKTPKPTKVSKKAKKSSAKKKPVKRKAATETTHADKRARDSPADSPSDDPGLRRSRRTRASPVQYWKNERIIYKQVREGSEFGGYEFEDKYVPTPLTTRRKRMYPKLANKRKKPAKAKSTSKKKAKAVAESESESDMDEDYVLEPSEFEVNDYLAEDEDETSFMTIAKTPAMLKWKSAKSDLRVSKTFTYPQERWSSGFVEIVGGGFKDNQVVKRNYAVFCIMSGKAEVTVRDNVMTLGKGSTFFVPPMNIYSIRNLKADKTCKLFFNIIKLPADVDQSQSMSQ